MLSKLAALLLVAVLVATGGVWYLADDFGSDASLTGSAPPPDDGGGGDEEPADEEPPQNWTLDGRLRPGASLGGYCTLNFLFVYPDGKLAIGTAGHCNDVNDTVSNPDVGEFGVVVFSVYDTGRELDFALIDIYESQYAESNPQVRRWGGPTAVAAADDTAAGELVDVYGYAVGAGASEATRPRQGLLIYDDEQEFHTDIPVWWGDSGGPVVMDGDRAGLGVVSRIDGGDGTTLTGTTVGWILQNLHDDGFPVELVTAEAL